MNRSTPGIPVHHQLPEFTQTHVHGVGDAIQPSHPLLPLSPPAPNPSQHQSLFQWVNSSHQVAKYWSLSVGINPSKEIPGLISFRMDWLDLLAATSKFRGEIKLPHFSEVWDSLLANDRTMHSGFNSDICFPCPVPMEDASTVMRKQEQIFSCCAC